MKTMLYRTVAVAALVMPSMAFAQSTGTIDAEEDAIVVTGSRGDRGVGGVVQPDSTKSRTVLNQDVIGRQAAGQSILNTINLVPGVNFTNSDPYGSSGGNIRIRGFDGNRISLTFDGLPLNDTGNYAIYSNQQLDPEIIDQVNVNQGTTDIDSPTASAAGGTVNYRTRMPGDTIGAVLQPSYGDYDYHRVFGMIDTGVFTSFGTKMFVSASMARNDKFKGPGRIYKQQYNARLYQPIGDDGDFVSIAAHWNKNRNNFYRNPGLTDLRTVTGRPNMVEVGGFTDQQWDRVFAFENDATCFRPTPVRGTAQSDSTGAAGACSNYYNVRINPSDTGNVRINSKFTITDGLVLTVDPSFQYTLANGGGSSTIAENSVIAKGALTASPGVDYNGDGDFLDTVRFYTPNTTNTRRWGVTASLNWNVTPEHLFRLAYTFDRGRHRQTGEWGLMDSNGNPENPFSGRNGTPVKAADGALLRQRDRLSIAMLNQIGAQYIGKFLDDSLRFEAGVRMPFFKRELENYCYTIRSSGFAYCSTQPAATVSIYNATTNPNGLYFLPFQAEYKYSPILPSAGFTYKFGDGNAVFANYNRGFSAPRTDNLYRASVIAVDPETTDSFDLGIRRTRGMVQGSLTAWYTQFKNRIVTSFDQDLGFSIDRNVGKVVGKGIDASVSVRPYDWMTFIGFASYNHSRLKEDVLVGNNQFAPTKGKQVVETPEWTAGYRAQFDFAPFSMGLQVKYVDDRFATDVNDVVSPGYTTADADAQISLDTVGLDNSYLQLNVINLFDRKYFGNLSTQIARPGQIGGGSPSFALGSPRTIMGTIRFGF